jgi:hypothetical protein
VALEPRVSIYKEVVDSSPHPYAGRGSTIARSARGRGAGWHRCRLRAAHSHLPDGRYRQVLRGTPVGGVFHLDRGRNIHLAGARPKAHPARQRWQPRKAPGFRVSAPSTIQLSLAKNRGERVHPTVVSVGRFIAVKWTSPDWLRTGRLSITSQMTRPTLSHGVVPRGNQPLKMPGPRDCGASSSRGVTYISRLPSA